MELKLAMTSQQATKTATVAILESDDVEDGDNCLCASDASDGWKPALTNERTDRKDLAELH